MKNKSINTSGTDSKQVFEKVESGIYQQKSNGCYYERPHIDGRRTWRSLGTQNLKLAREEFHKRRVMGQVAYVPKGAITTGRRESHVADGTANKVRAADRSKDCVVTSSASTSGS